MHQDLIDRSNYFRGLLLLAGNSKEISMKEEQAIKRIAKVFNYEPEFVDNALSDLPENEYITRDPPVFINPEFAKKFIHDGLSMAFINGLVRDEIINWIELTALRNNLSKAWFNEELEYFKNNRYKNESEILFAYKKSFRLAEQNDRISEPGVEISKVEKSKFKFSKTVSRPKKSPADNYRALNFNCFY